jgi:hypothetical protein
MKRMILTLAAFGLFLGCLLNAAEVETPLNMEESFPVPVFTPAPEPTPNHVRARLADPDPLVKGHWLFANNIEFFTANQMGDRLYQQSSGPLVRSNVFELEARYGLYPALELGIAWGMAQEYTGEDWQDTEGWHQGPHIRGGLTDLRLSAKWRAIQQQGPMSITYLPWVSLPAGVSTNGFPRGGPGMGCTVWSNAVAANWDFDDFGAQAQLGYDLPLSDNRGDQRGLMHAGAGAWLGLEKNAQLGVSLDWSHDLIENTEGTDRLAGSVDATVPVGWGFLINLGLSRDVMARNRPMGYEINARVHYLL